MSFDNVSGKVNSLGNTLGQGGGLADKLLNRLGGTGGESKKSWREKLRPASFRGVPFGVLEGQLRFGRRGAIHEFPFRDSVWVEDLGRAARRVSFMAFLVGDDCIVQRDKLIKACEEAAAITGGELVHPTLGRMTVSLAEEVTCVEMWDRGRYFELAFSFVEQGKRLYPVTTASTAQQVKAAAVAAKAASKASFLATAVAAIRSGIATVLRVVSMVQAVTRYVQGIVNDATNLIHFIKDLPGEFGRLFGSKATKSKAAASSSQVTVPSLLAIGTKARADVAIAAGAVSLAAGALASVAGKGLGSSNAQATAPAGSGAQSGDVGGSQTGGSGGAPVPNQAGVHGTSEAITALGNFADSVHALADALTVAAPSPPDAMRLLGAYGNAAPGVPVNLPAPKYPVVPSAALAVPDAVSLMASATSDLVRRSALIAMAAASADYQPSSFDDAAAVREHVVAQMDAEIQVAGNQGQDESYEALCVLRAAVVADLTARGADLGALVSVHTPSPVPALVVAQRVYRNAGRSDEMVAAADAVHPAFMPTTFRTLAR